MEPLSKLIKSLTKLQGIGEKTATRLAYQIARWEKGDAIGLADAISDLKNKVTYCPDCFNLIENDFCPICTSANRNKSTICVVEEPQDAQAIEKTGTYNGLYHVLHGALSPLDGIGPDEIRSAELITRLKKNDITELIIATNPTTIGEATALYIAKLARPLNIKITRIAFGIPFGGDIEYIDKSTLARSIQTRSGISL